MSSKLVSAGLAEIVLGHLFGEEKREMHLKRYSPHISKIIRSDRIYGHEGSDLDFPLFFEAAFIVRVSRRRSTIL